MQLKDGSVYEGVFSSIDSDSVLLRMARLVRDSTGQAPRSTLSEPTKAIAMNTWVEINAKDVRMGAGDVGPFGAGDDAGGFGTDAAISRGRGAAQGRELQRWTPDIDDSQLLHLEESAPSTGRGWDQFALNERKFGVRTDYHEELYTTALDPSKSKISMAEANRLATEIERGMKSDTTNIHRMEERGMEIDDGDMDEEDRYGAVMRDAPPPPGEEFSRSSSGTVPSSSSSSSYPRTAPPPPPRGPSGAWGRGAPSTSVPISIDPRKETNKVRAHMNAPKVTSPYGTPKQQLSSPLIGNPKSMEGLDLNPGRGATLGETINRDFMWFKSQQEQPVSKNKVPDKEWSANLVIKPESSPVYKAAATIARLAAEDAKKYGTTTTTTATTTASGGETAAAAATPGGASTTTEKASTTTPSAAAAGDQQQQQPETGAKKLSLNPNAKSFSFNLNAKEFTPGGGGGGGTFKPAATAAPSTTTSTTTTTTPGATPPVVPRPSSTTAAIPSSSSSTAGGGGVGVGGGAPSQRPPYRNDGGGGGGNRDDPRNYNNNNNYNHRGGGGGGGMNTRQLHEHHQQHQQHHQQQQQQHYSIDGSGHPPPPPGHGRSPPTGGMQMGVVNSAMHHPGVMHGHPGHHHPGMVNAPFMVPGGYAIPGMPALGAHQGRPGTMGAIHMAPGMYGMAAPGYAMAPDGGRNIMVPMGMPMQGYGGGMYGPGGGGGGGGGHREQQEQHRSGGGGNME